VDASINVTSSLAGSTALPNVPVGMLQIQPVSGTTQGQFFLCQYIDGMSMLPYWGYRMSVLVRARILTSANTQVQLKCRLFSSDSLPGTLSAPGSSAGDPISGWDANKNPIMPANYSPRIPTFDQAYTLQNAYENEAGNTAPLCPVMKFENITNNVNYVSNANAVLGILLYTQGQMAATDTIIIESVSLVPNEFAMDSQAQTYDQVLQACQYYYETSYNPGIYAPNGSYLGAISTLSGNNSSTLYGMDRPFRVKKRTMPMVTWYSPMSGTANMVTLQGATTGTDLTVKSTTYAGFGSTGMPVLTTSLTGTNPILGQYIADARLGVVT